MIGPELTDLINRPSTIAEQILYWHRDLNLNRLEKSVQHKNILITGASRGIGAAMVQYLAQFNVSLYLVARDTVALNHLVESYSHLPAKIYIFTLDLRNEIQVAEFIQSLAQQHIEIDILIHNAGKSIYRNVLNSLDRLHDSKRCMDLNFTAAVQLTLGLLPGIIKKRGCIVNVSALNVLLPPTAGWSAYQASKTALDQWLRCAEPEFKIQNVRLRHIYLPLVRTQMSMVNAAKIKQPSMHQNEAARIILSSLYRTKRTYKPYWAFIPIALSNSLAGIWNQIQIHNLSKNNKV